MSDSPKTDGPDLPTLDQADWEWLKPHAERDSLILVDRSLDLLVVALAIAQDDKAQVATWIAQHLLTRPTAEQLKHMDDRRKYLFSIVQPFVLAQEGAFH